MTAPRTVLLLIFSLLMTSGLYGAGAVSSDSQWSGYQIFAVLFGMMWVLLKPYKVVLSITIKGERIRIRRLFDVRYISSDNIKEGYRLDSLTDLATNEDSCPSFRTRTGFYWMKKRYLVVNLKEGWCKRWIFDGGRSDIVNFLLKRGLLITDGSKEGLDLGLGIDL